MTSTFELHHGDSLDILKSLPSNSVDSIVTDPPYGLSKHSQNDVAACLSAWLSGEEYKPNKRGFMGRSWDAWVPGPELWKEALRVLKPGGHALIFAGSRTQDLMGVSLRLAGFEIKDTLMWVYAQGFPKNQDISKAIDKKAGAKRKVIGIKPGHEEFAGRATTGHLEFKGGSDGFDRPWMHNDAAREHYHMQTEPATDEAKQWDGWGTALKPAYEPIILCRKPLDGTVVNNILKHGVGGLNINASRIPLNDDHKSKQNGRPSQTGLGDHYDPFAANQPDTVGRWPSNFLHDGSGEVLAAFPDAPGQQGDLKEHSKDRKSKHCYGNMKAARDCPARVESNKSAARFFYCAKTNKNDRHEGVLSEIPNQFKMGSTLRAVESMITVGNNHPTVKPTELMRYLIRLITPPGGVVLDQFMGSGSTGKACALDGFRFIGIDADAGHVAIAEQRIVYAQGKVAAAS